MTPIIVGIVLNIGVIVYEWNNPHPFARVLTHINAAMAGASIMTLLVAFIIFS